MTQYLFQALLKYQPIVNAFAPLVSITFGSLLEHYVIIHNLRLLSMTINKWGHVCLLSITFCCVPESSHDL